MFVDADKPGLLFLPVVARCGRIAHDRKFCVGPMNSCERFGHQVLVFHVGDRRLDADPFPDFARIAAGGVDHMFTGDVALLGHDLELAGGQHG